MMSSFDTVTGSLLKRMPTFRSSNHSTIVLSLPNYAPRIVAGTRIKTRFALANDTRQSAGSPPVSVQRHHERQLRQRRRRGHRPALHPYRSVCPRATHPNRENLAALTNFDEENLPRPISWMATACCRSTARTQVRDEPLVYRKKSSLARTHRPP